MIDKKTTLLSGYYIGIKRKEKFIDYYPNKILLESSYSQSHKYFFFKKSEIYYSPQFCMSTPLLQVLKSIIMPKFWHVKFDQRELKTLYKKEVNTFSIYRLLRFNMFLRIKFLTRLRKKIKKWLVSNMNMPQTSDTASEFVLKYNKEIDKGNTKSGFILKLYARYKKSFNRFIFIFGYRHMLMTIHCICDKHNINTITQWGPHTSLNVILRRVSKEYRIKHTTVEYGEVPGTFSFNRQEMFHKSDFHIKLNNIRKMRRLNEPKTETVDQVLKIKSDMQQNASSIDSYIKLKKETRNESILTALESRIRTTKTLYPLTIYVNGVESVLSNWIFSKSNTIRRNPNEKLLETILTALGCNVLILYREHPLLFKNSPKLKCNEEIFENKNIIDVSEYPLESTIYLSDLVISMPSKVHIETLLLDRKLISIGKTIFPKKFNVQNLTITKNIYELDDEDIKKAIHKSTEKSNYDISYIDMIAHLKEHNEKNIITLK